MVTGANTDGVHVCGVDIDRDITVGRWMDLRQVAAGEPCPECRSPLEVVRAIEIGHIFKLGLVPSPHWNTRWSTTGEPGGVIVGACLILCGSAA